MRDIDKTIAVIRAGGVEAAVAFFETAAEFYDRKGKSGLTSWVRTAFEQLPEEDREVFVCMALETQIRESRRS